jgi:hypothetical protein
VEGDSAKSAETFVLVRSTAPQDVSPLATEARKGFTLAAFMFATEDHARLMALKNRIVAAKGTAKPVKGAIHITAKSCDPAMPKPAGPYPVSTYLMVDRADGYNPMIVDYDLGPEMRKANPGSLKTECGL